MDPTAAITHHALPVEGGELPLTLARGAGRGAALLIVPAAFGVTPDLEAQMAELAADARLVVAVDPFVRDDPGTPDYGDMARVLRRLAALDRERFDRDLRAALDWTRQAAGGAALVMLGVCFGGAFALRAAADGAVDGAATWHGGRMETLAHRAPEVRCPLRLHFGAVDPLVSMAAVDALRAAFAGRDEVEIVVHPGATHGFSHRGATAAYDAPAERAALASLRALVAAARPLGPA